MKKLLAIVALAGAPFAQDAWHWNTSKVPDMGTWTGWDPDPPKRLKVCDPNCLSHVPVVVLRPGSFLPLLVFGWRTR